MSLLPDDRAWPRFALCLCLAALGGALACAVPASESELPPACARTGAAAPPVLPHPDRTLLVAGEVFDILVAGPATGEVVLLLQGFPDASYDHRAALPRLANVGYRAIAAIRRSASGAPASSNTARAPQVLALADALGLSRFHVAGGELAWDVARLAPQRVISIARTPPAQIAAISALEHAAPTCPAQTR